MLVKKIAAGVVGGILITSLVATSAFAGHFVEISGNGAWSYNSIRIKNKTECNVYQKNSTLVVTEVDSSASTGGNSASGNTGGDVDIDTGNADSTVIVTVEGSSNTADNPCCCTCDGCDSSDQEEIISGNGSHSTNSISVKKEKRSSINQNNWTEVYTGVYSKSKTGRNRSNHNTGGTVDVATGNADSTVDILVTTSSNTLNP